MHMHNNGGSEAIVRRENTVINDNYVKKKIL